MASHRGCGSRTWIERDGEHSWYARFCRRQGRVRWSYFGTDVSPYSGATFPALIGKASAQEFAEEGLPDIAEPR